jgi:hypothetical protein
MTLKGFLAMLNDNTKARIMTMIADARSLEKELAEHHDYQSIRSQIQEARVKLEATISHGELETKQ